MTTPDNHTHEEQLKTLVEKISAYVEQFHGGSAFPVTPTAYRGRCPRAGSESDIGACLGCPLSPSTLQGWVAGTVHQFFPDIKVVAAAD